MSDLHFDKEKFASLLLSAKGKRSITKYGKESNVDPGYISRLVRCLVDSPPSANIIKKLTSKAENNVTFSELMHAAGYFEKRHRIVYQEDMPFDEVTVELKDKDLVILFKKLKEAPEEQKKEVIDFFEYIRQRKAK